MDEEQFWSLIELIGPDLNFSALEVALSKLEEDEIFGFHDQLGRAVAALGTPEHLKAFSHLVGGPLMSDSDALEDVQLGIVASGRQRWEQVVRDPSEARHAGALEMGEGLLDAVRGAFESSTNKPWPPVSLQTPIEATLPPVRRPFWIHIFPPEELDHQHPGYKAHLLYLQEFLNRDDAWWHWWDSARGEESTLEYWIEPRATRRARATFRVRRDFANRDEVVCAAVVPMDRHSSLTGPELAREHVEVLFNELQQKFGISPPIEIPSTAQLEEQRVTTEKQRAEDQQRELDALANWNRMRSSEHIWRGRAPDAAVDELIRETERGGRIVRLPQMIARLRADYAIPVDPTDAQRLAEAGYSVDEIGIILGQVNEEPTPNDQ